MGVHPKILIGKQIHESSSVWLAQLLTLLIRQIGKVWGWMQIRTETFFELNLLNWLEQWCCRSTCCTWGVLKASGEQVASRLVVPTHHCKRQKFGGTGLSWWAFPGHTMLRTLQSAYRMQNIFTERTEAFCMQLLPGLRSFTSTSVCSKRKDLYLSDILEGVCMNGGEAGRILHVPLFTTEIKGFLHPAPLDLKWWDMTKQSDIKIWTCIYTCVCLWNAN